ncbi:MAG TPA: MBOAT family O-acyltransferase [Alphaproteobacteria bacterium]|nr:MBOAT family O-acyltransferase [Alphaproteobacteria bacterium]
MLFNSIPFIGVFLPICLVVAFLLAERISSRAALAWLAFASVVFYGYWRIEDVPVLLGSIAFNYVVGRKLQERSNRLMLAAGVAGNLVLLGYFKYLMFLTVTANATLGNPITVPQIVLPLGISFYTFQQIAYLVDSHGGVVKERNFLSYFFFVSFFPQLIAGPIVHHAEVMPQLRRFGMLRFNLDDFSVGLTIFAIGLAKKVVIADRVAPLADGPFDAAAAGVALTMIEAWAGALAFALQIYFDFSGYSDMAIGLARMLGIRLPLNFASPYKAASIIEFWSRWHMTLTRFLTNYIYNPLSLRAARARAEQGRVPLRRRGAAIPGAFAEVLMVPTLATMILSGFWHGAGFQFVLWGGLHGLFLVVNHGWRLMVLPRLGWTLPKSISRPASVLLTFAVVVLTLVFFRADSISHGWMLVTAMLGSNGIMLPPAIASQLSSLSAVLPVLPGHMKFLSPNEGLALLALLAAVWFLPNTQELMSAQGIHMSPEEELDPARPERARIRFSPAFGLAAGALGSLAMLYTASAAPTKFIYFNF